MIPDKLEPQRQLLQQEFVLVQAWKKTSRYIRNHNWYSDTLALDRAAVDLPQFLGELRERLQSAETWQNDPLRIVPAPKSQQWRVDRATGRWEPVKSGTLPSRLRPLAHASLPDQVLATAILLCISDRVENLQGDPRETTTSEQSRKHIVSYGNRLFCHRTPGKLQHAWGSMKLYRAYYEDYRAFLSRPDSVAQPLSAESDTNPVFIVHADLRQFYDRVRPEFLAGAMDKIRRRNDDPTFFHLAQSVLDWSWDSRDISEVVSYSRQAGLDDFSRVALPQGLVASGFFANLVLLSFDAKLKQAIGTEIAPGMVLADACRYVDDLRFTVTAESPAGESREHVQAVLCAWLKQVLDEEAYALELSDKKTLVVPFGRDVRPPVRQSARMNRIQAAVSGGFDAHGGEAILDAIHGLMGAQEKLNQSEDSQWHMSPLPDVPADTVSRFAAFRFRTTVRSLRPLLDDVHAHEASDSHDATSQSATARRQRTQHDLDQDTRSFALNLIHRWVHDPSNVRLLRIGLDLWPDVEVLSDVLAFLRPFTVKRGSRKVSRRVAWYSLSEIFRAGATETGLAADGECLPAGTDLPSYRRMLREEATRLLRLPAKTIPWYLQQQALLFLAAVAPSDAPIVRTGTRAETLHYRQLIRFLRGDHQALESAEFATLAVLARRAYGDRRRAHELASAGLNPERGRQIAHADPSFLLELLDTHKTLLEELPDRIREDLSRVLPRPPHAPETLADLVAREHPCGSLRNELSLLRFAVAFLREWLAHSPLPDVIVPSHVQLKLADRNGIASIDHLRILTSGVSPSGSLYRPPAWCEEANRWRFHLGFLLRFALSGQSDYTRPVRSPHLKERESSYRPAASHWYQRLYSLFSGQPAFGDDWLPITDWMELFLLALLRWPGCPIPVKFDWVEQGIDHAIAKISHRIAQLEQRLGKATGTLQLSMVAKRPTTTTATRTLRACVVQTVIPTQDDFKLTDLKLDDPAIRKRHRNHLAAALAAVERMLALRGTHRDKGGHLDWLILPELAVHPDDVRTHLVPFARTHRAMILAGLTYDQIIPGQPLVNSALWVIPEYSRNYGLQIRTRRQGKAFLARYEHDLNKTTQLVQGFRPCQWLVGYPWFVAGSEPLWLTAAVCYDATDLRLAADLRDLSDILAIPALNKDVNTFDQMALALHYHMFQLVVVANNGRYGGSNAYWPTRDPHVRRIFHMHGQPQASVAFLEIDDIAGFLQRQHQAASGTGDWKYPPAGLNTRSP